MFEDKTFTVNMNGAILSAPLLEVEDPTKADLAAMVEAYNQKFAGYNLDIAEKCYWKMSSREKHLRRLKMWGEDLSNYNLIPDSWLGIRIVYDPSFSGVKVDLWFDRPLPVEMATLLNNGIPL